MNDRRLYAVLLFARDSETFTEQEIISLLCKALSLQLYVEEGGTYVNYMISGNTFVIDLCYSKEGLGKESEASKSSAEPAGTTSGSVSEIAHREQVDLEFGEVLLKSVRLSLVEEEWTRYFDLFTWKLFKCFELKEYVEIGVLLEEFIKYDKEKEGSFEDLYRSMSVMEAEIRRRIGNDVSISYFFEEHKPAIILHSDQESLDSGDWGISSVHEGKYVQVDLCGTVYSPEEWIETMKRTREAAKSLYRIIRSAFVFRVPISLEIRDGKVVSVYIDGKTNRLDENCIFYRNDKMMEELTLILKRTESIHNVMSVLRETNCT